MTDAVIFHQVKRIIRVKAALDVPAKKARVTMSKPTCHAEFLSRIEEHRAMLFKVANSYCRNPQDREDLVQEMVFQLWRSFERYDDRQRFPTWMYRVVLNVAISFSRSERRRSRTTVTVDNSILQLAVEGTPGPGLEDDVRLLQQYIDQLNELDRALVILYLDGNRYETIAEVLGISVTNVGTKISRIKQKIHRDWPEPRT